ncbi:hypothetical protein IVA83_10735 [Bradyrhizobium sp. 143]|nr:hypothetical protein [Bradyrhizobium sp. 143]
MRRRADRSGRPGTARLRVGAQILIDLGVRELVLLTNSKKSMVGVEGFDLKVIGQKPIPGHANL